MRVSHGRSIRERKLAEKDLTAMNPRFMSYTMKKRAAALEVDGVLKYSSEHDDGRITVIITRTK